MHFAFIPYGARAEVERLMRDVESQKFQLKLIKEGEKDKSIWVTGQVRELPFGVKEIVFPKEYKDLILNTLLSNTAPNRYTGHKLYKTFQLAFRKALGLSPVPKEYVQDHKLLWDLEYVSIMPLGMREDADVNESKDMGYKGWDHEGL